MGFRRQVLESKLVSRFRIVEQLEGQPAVEQELLDGLILLRE